MNVDQQQAPEDEVRITLGSEPVISAKHYQWSAYHTFTIICLRLCGDLMSMVPLMFDDELSEESLTSLQVFSYVNIARFVGIVLSIFWSPLNMKWFQNDNKSITIAYAVSSSIFTVLFGISYFMKQMPRFQYLPASMITWQCIMWLLNGISFSIYNAGTIAIATQYSDPSKHGRILSTISLSWSISSVFYLVAAYLITLHPSLPFIVFGALLLLFAVLIYLTYNFDIVFDENPDAENEPPEQQQLTERVNMKQIGDVLTDEYYGLVLGISFFISIASGANISILGSPLLHDLYGLNVSQVGWALLVTFLGEFTSNLYMVKYVDKIGFFRTASYGLALKVFAGISILFVAMHHDANSWISLTITLCMVFAVFFAWEMVFVSQLTALNDAVDTKEQNRNIRDSHKSQKRLVFVIHSAVISVAKPIGIWFASSVWREGDGLIYVGFLLIFTSLTAAVCYYVYWRKRTKIFIYQGVASTDVSSGVETDIASDVDHE